MLRGSPKITNFNLLLVFVIFSQNTCSQNPIEFSGGADIQLRDSLRKDSEFVQASCGIGQSDDIIEKESKIKLKAYQNFINNDGISKIKIKCETNEGDPIYSYLTVLKGEASILIDISEAKNVKKEVTLYKCRELEIGKFSLDEKTQESIFQVLNNSELEGQKELSLRCLSKNEKILF
ncbi:MAG: hypothetical protein ACR2MD_15955 [Aridibacter sp.]